MSKRKLPVLKNGQSNLMEHIAHFVCQTVNIINRHTSEKAVLLYEELVHYMTYFWSQLFLTTSVEKDEEGNVTGFETEEGYVPLLTADEISAFKAFLADYKKQFELTRNINHND